MGITIRYLAPAAAGTAFTYSVERHADEAFFDFELRTFRPLGDISAHAIAAPLIYHDGAATAVFDPVEGGVSYTIRIHRVGMGDRIVAEIPLTTQDADGRISASNGEAHMEPSYRAGKKFLDGEVIEARHRLTFYGNDGFTIHTATLWDDGTSSCNCPRWTRKMQGMERGCVHSQRALLLTANIDETGERPDPPPPAVPRDTSPFRRRSRSVDT